MKLGRIREMDVLEKIEDQLYNNNIAVDSIPLQSVDAFALVYNNEPRICINKNKEMTKINKRCILEHEYSHILTNAYYTTDNSIISIKRKETKANDNLINRLNLVAPVIEMLKQGMAAYDICEELEINQEIYECCIKYAKRKQLI